MSVNRKTKYNRIKAVLRENAYDPCVFCNRTVDDELNYGNIYTLHDISCHYFCVLLSSCAIQSGNDNEGLFGFLYSKIIEEVARGKKNKCSYCNSYGATLGCSFTQCRKQFHLPCGRERNAISIFHGTFKSFCETHAPKQDIPSDILALAKERKRALKIQTTTLGNKGAIDLDTICVICCENVPGYLDPQSFWPPCCARDVWFHRTCIQRMALSSGVHYLKCPLCNDKEMFYRAVLKHGFYVPDRDAAWELEQNAFNDMYERTLKCDAEVCKCDDGRSYDSEAGLWDIKLCLLCGSVGAHAGCLNEVKNNFICDSCSKVEIPENFEQLLESVKIQEHQVTGSRSGPRMPSRMSIRRTKQWRSDYVPIARTSRVATETNTTAMEPYKEILDKYTKCLNIDELELLLKKMEGRLQKPMPFRVKNKLNATIEGLHSFIKLKKNTTEEDEKCIVTEELEKKDIEEEIFAPNPNITEVTDTDSAEESIKFDSNIVIEEKMAVPEESSIIPSENIKEDIVILELDDACIEDTLIIEPERKAMKRKHDTLKEESTKKKNHKKKKKKNKKQKLIKEKNTKDKNIKEKNKYKIKFKETPKRKSKPKMKVSPLNLSPKLFKQTELSFSPNKAISKSVRKDKKRSLNKLPSPNDNFKQTTLYNYFNCQT